jgi:ribosomal protein S18 acetylase RimI-like enzyme
MRIELDEPVAPPVLPADVRIRKVRDDDADLETVFRIVDTAFEDHFGHLPGRTYPQWIAELRKRSGLDLSLWWIAEVGGEPMSALIGWQFPDDDGGEVGHVGTLGTLRAARGRGIGTAMLTTAFAEYHSRGLRAATLGVDAENLTGAVRLYESVGMHVNHDWVLYELKPSPTTS